LLCQGGGAKGGEEKERAHGKIGYWILDIGYWILDIGYWILVIEYSEDGDSHQ
jgi:hypothetical protein